MPVGEIDVLAVGDNVFEVGIHAPKPALSDVNYFFRRVASSQDVTEAAKPVNGGFTGVIRQVGVPGGWECRSGGDARSPRRSAARRLRGSTRQTGSAFNDRRTIRHHARELSLGRWICGAHWRDLPGLAAVETSVHELARHDLSPLPNSPLQRAQLSRLEAVGM